MRRKSRQVVLALVLMVAGFMLTFSYQYAKADKKRTSDPAALQEWKVEDQLRSKVLRQQNLNHHLWLDIQEKRNKVTGIENQTAKNQKISEDLVKQLRKYRMFLGKEPVSGPGIVVTLSDSQYVPNGANPNDYIVHEQHIRKVFHELLVTGAEAVAVNGQRITDYSYIKCVGPVVKVDGHKYPAPFVISAIGDPEKLTKSLFLPGNTVDQLVNQNITVKVAKKQHLVIPAMDMQKGR
ncbi:MAG TPA: DUF881 domain-containing protein [Bacillales bacterium]|nr:DUF881 domain-containing protein [Bacillales bacterium]